MPIAELLPVRDLAACCAPLTDQIIPVEAAEQLARTLKALAEPARLRILSIIAAGGEDATCVCDLTEPLGLSQPTVSHHLKVLTEAGFLQRSKRGTWAYFRLTPGSLNSIARVLETV